MFTFNGKSQAELIAEEDYEIEEERSKVTRQGIRDLNTYPRNGKRKPEWKLVLCPECDGRGIVFEPIFMEDLTCGRCNGDGQIAVPWERRRKR